MTPLDLDLGATRIAPYRVEEAERLAALGNDADVARQMTSVPHPFTEAQARNRIESYGWQGRPGFVAGLRDRQGVLVGEVGMGSEATPSVMYWVGPDHRGQRHATRGLRGFVADMLSRFDLHALAADCWAENEASAAVLRAAGFRETGRDTVPASDYHPAGPIRLFRLERS